MIEKVNPCHPDKVADRIAGAIATNILNLAMKGDIKAAQYINGLQLKQQLNAKRK